ncbi:alpha/beta fold hydrolase [Georgenia muralis]|uniref:Acyl-CoA synthetase (AMP-forming)/AMP-acid ligase II n=1 Tax=Georgenia muralis TaxID=154117 RepID=A0A3N4Z9P0_9MICO|nr:alpha/beta fold hydrolase [Georgenia muralis]RPF28833.1 acyl-CoA synthetase (AMP-forming)/AMP-acid ligase II [Georgenia muralis]
MSARSAAPGAQAWPGVDPAWSRRVAVDGHEWHLLDNAPSLTAPARGVLLCVHGNPTWSYLWRSVLAAGASAGWRVVAVDQLEMGWSERSGAHHRLADRVAQLGRLTDTLGISGDGEPEPGGALPVVAVGHDWGGVVVSGWAVDHPRELAALVLTNTAVHHDDAVPVPGLLRLARRTAVHSAATVLTPAFLEVTLSLASPALSPAVRAAFRSPYTTAERRRGIGAFVEDIPVDARHPSHRELGRIADGVAALDVPALLMWGPRDPVFYERYLRDLRERLPQADVHRFEGAGHLVVEDADVAGVLVRWLAARGIGLPAADPQALDRDVTALLRHETDSAALGPGGELRADSAPYEPLWAALDSLADTDGPAVVSLRDGAATTVTWRRLAADVRHLALGLVDAGVRPRQRVSLLVPPGAELTTALFACLRIGAVVVLADAGLGTAGLTRAVRGADPDVTIGIDRALLGARTLGWPGRRVLVAAESGSGADPLRRRILGAEGTYRDLIAQGRRLEAAGIELPPEPGPDADAAVLFTSGSTGPAKGVAYTHRGLAGMRDVVGDTYGLSPERPFVAGFAPFALLGTALGATSATPDMDVTAPATLTAGALADAVAAIDARAVFASPSALANVVRTAGEVTGDGRSALGRVEVLLSAGAPIAPERLAAAAALVPSAAAHTPYGMTEALPVTDVSLEEIRQAAADAASGTVRGAGGGTCVGRPVGRAQVLVVPLDDDGRATGQPTDEAGVTGEVLVSAPNLKDRYDRLWATEADSRTWPGWHRTGDVGHLDGVGRLWVEGRLTHVISTAAGVVTPVAVENAALAVAGVGRAAAVGVGPAGTQQVVVVVETDPDVHAGARRSWSLAPAGLARAVRARATVPVAAVLRVPEIPTDVRHNSKVERTRLAAWAERALAGARVGNP